MNFSERAAPLIFVIFVIFGVVLLRISSLTNQQYIIPKSVSNTSQVDNSHVQKIISNAYMVIDVQQLRQVQQKNNFATESKIAKLVR